MCLCSVISAQILGRQDVVICCISEAASCDRTGRINKKKSDKIFLKTMAEFFVSILLMNCFHYFSSRGINLMAKQVDVIYIAQTM